MRAYLAAVLVVGACGAPNAGSDDAPPPDADGSNATPDGGDGYKLLIERDWTQPAGEDYWCRRIHVTEDMYLNGFRAEAPTGTHHAIVTMTSTLQQTQQTGTYHCDPTATDSEMLFAGGIGMEKFELPEGVAIKVPAGSYINLNLHIDNRTSGMLGGTSGVYVKTIPAAMVQHEADVAFVGNMYAMAYVPANSTGNIYGECQAPAEWHVLGFVPHMHTIGVGVKVDEMVGTNLLQNRLSVTSYDVNAQHSYPVDFVLPLNHTLQVTCEYNNTTSQKRYIAESAYQSEQCLIGMYRWPKGVGPYTDKFGCVTSTP